LMRSINYNASVIYRQLSNLTDVELNWREDYIVELKSTSTSRLITREFRQLSGGEQMAVALSIRLALLQSISNLDFAFFDEPTTNLDVEKKENLANAIKNIEGLRQFFVISHDNTFEDEAHHVIHFKKEDDVTKITYNS
jgi:DNA repair protein SbcC/Rad50